MKSKEFWVDIEADGQKAYHITTFDMQEGLSGQITIFCEETGDADKFVNGGHLVLVHRVAKKGDESAAVEDMNFVQQLIKVDNTWSKNYEMLIKPAAKGGTAFVLPPVSGGGKGPDAPWTKGKTSFNPGLDADRIHQISYNNPIPGPFHLVLKKSALNSSATVASGGKVRFYIKWQVNH